MREREVERCLKREVEKRGGKCLKFVPDQDPGMPDRLVLFPGGVAVWVELKRPDGKVRKLQEYRHGQLRDLGQRVEVVLTKEQACRLAEEIGGKMAGNVQL